ncbi:ABC transporter substrate-binding protein [Paeniroseomonas aquatica]|uniref:ABC transporter substrate-binding protein n=1 Tax=Paeniroseomonas aquatica TaxID=373043 RepID=UPI003612CB80
MAAGFAREAGVDWGCQRPAAWEESATARPPRKDAHVEDRPSPAAWRPRRPGRTGAAAAGPGWWCGCGCKQRQRRAPGAAPAPAAGSELRLGALFPFSGSLALLGDESFRGLELAVEERNAAGGLLGRAIRLAKGDAAGPEQAMAELRRLQSAERVAAGFGTFASHLGFAASQAAEMQGLPYFELGAIADPITERGFRNLYRLCPRASDFARDSVAVIPELLAGAWSTPAAALRIAVLHEDGLYGQTVSGLQESQLRARGLTQVERIGYSARTVELSPVLERLRAVRADVVLHTGYQNDIVLFYRGMKEAGWRPRMVIGSGAGYSLTDTARSVGPEFEGTLDVDFPVAVAEAVAPGVAAFVELYKKRYGSDPRSGHSLANYVGARLVLEALQRAGGLERDKVRAALLATDVAEGTTATGWGARFDEKGQNLRARPCLAQWQGGRLVTVGPAEAAVAPLRAVMGGTG